MRKYLIPIFLLLAIEVLCIHVVNAQDLRSRLLQLTTRSDSLNNARPAEHLYLQLDKPYYTAGDTIWFKAYLLNAYLLPVQKSTVLHIDLCNDSNKVVKRYLFPARNGVSWSNIGLDEKDFRSGTYTLYAYTNWMRNEGQEFFYHKTFYITAPDRQRLLVNTVFSSTVTDGLTIVNANLQLTSPDQLPFAAIPVALSVVSKGKSFYSQKLLTGVDGVLKVNFDLPQKASGLALAVADDKKNKLAVIPVLLNRPENTDVQFMPEGGNLVAGLPAHIGFKAVSEDGKACDVSGIINDNEKRRVAFFSSMHKGMGSFDIQVKAGERYMAQVTLPGGLVKSYPLPAVKENGLALQINQKDGNDSVDVRLGASDAIAVSGESYFLVAKARGVVCYAAVLNFHEGVLVIKKISEALFPTGIVRFTLMTAAYQPLNERMIFVNHHDQLNISISTDRLVYKNRDSAGVTLKVTGQDGKAVRGNFSAAVTDNAQVNKIPGEENILSRMLLTSGLQGYVEDPGYYFLPGVPNVSKALDNLLLTQGWVNYDWRQVLAPPAITFKPEDGLPVTGHVRNVFNKPVAGTHVLLFSKRPAILMDTVTDKDGKFIFDHLPRVDTPIFILKAVNKNGKSYNVGISIDEVSPPVFDPTAEPETMPWYVNSDSTLIHFNNTGAQARLLQNYPAGGHLLREVNIRAKKMVKGSQNLNGPGNADFVLDEKDMEAAGKKTLLQLLQEQVPGFKEGFMVLTAPTQKAATNRLIASLILDDMDAKITEDENWYYVNGKPVKFIIDGISLYKIMRMVPPALEDINNYLNSVNAEDIKGIEVNSSSKYASRYVPIEWGMKVGMSEMAFIEITTRSGGGPVIDHTPGMYLYKPLPVTLEKQFYKPKFSVSDTSSRWQSLRSTIDWEPNLTTNEKGEATFWFTANRHPGGCTIVVEGADMTGELGYKQSQIGGSKPADPIK